MHTNQAHAQTDWSSDCGQLQWFLMCIGLACSDFAFLPRTSLPAFHSSQPLLADTARYQGLLLPRRRGCRHHPTSPSHLATKVRCSILAAKVPPPPASPRFAGPRRPSSLPSPCAVRARALVPAHSCQRADNVLFWPAVTSPPFSLRRRSPSPPLPVATAPRRHQGPPPPPRRRRSPSPPSRTAGPPVAAAPQVRRPPPVAAAPRAVRPKMTPRFRRLLAVSRGQAPRPGVVEDRSSCAHHHRRIKSTKTVSAFWHFPHPKSP